jgi:virulence-associated protein VapD
LYDLRLNTGYVHIGTSHDTGEFACDALRGWWLNHGKQNYPTATSILLLCDGGGSNSSIKQDLQRLVNELNIEIRITHYLPYTSKYNPIKHRLFPHLTRVTQGVIFEGVEMVRDLMSTAKTQTGLTVFATILDQVYQTGRKVSQEFKQTMEIVFDEIFQNGTIPLDHKVNTSRSY